MALSDIVPEAPACDQVAFGNPAINYLIDTNDLILKATATDCFNTDYDALVGTPLLYHVNGIGSAAFIKGVLDKARMGVCVRIPYRCDTQDRKRSWFMEAHAVENGCVLIQHYLVKDEPRRGRWAFRTATTSFLGAVPRCSVCNRILLNDRWQDPEDCGEAAGDQKVIEVVYEICSPCEQLVRL